MSGPGSWVILALVIGAAVLATVVLIGMGGGRVVTSLPEELEGFELVNQFDHIEPIFPGERYSMLNSFAPTAGSPFAEEVERMGVTAYLFKARKSATTALELLIGSTYSEAQEITLNKHKVQFFANAEAGQAGLIWQDGPILYEVFITSPATPADISALQEAALVAARAIIGAR